MYDAAESILKGLINGKCDAYAITSDLKILDPDVNINSHKDFLEILNHEISSDKNNVLYREFELLWKRQLSESLSNYFEKNNCNHEETHKKINKIEKDTKVITSEIDITPAGNLSNIVIKEIISNILLIPGKNHKAIKAPIVKTHATI